MSEILQRTASVIGRDWKTIFTSFNHAAFNDYLKAETKFELMRSSVISPEIALEKMKEVFNHQCKSGFIPLYSNNCDEHQAQNGVLALPVFGFVLWKIYKTTKAGNSIDILHEFYPKILNYHHHIYTQRAYLEDGLAHIWHPDETLLLDIPNWKNALETKLSPTLSASKLEQSQYFKWNKKITIQDPFFNSLLVLSNEALIKIASILGKDASDLIEWNELTVYSLNEKLWNPESKQYQAFNSYSETFIHTPLITGMMPIIAQIPDHNRAHEICALFKSVPASELLECSGYCQPELMSKQTEQSLITASWLLYKGLKQYKFNSLSKQLKQQVFDWHLKCNRNTFLPNTLECLN